MKKIICTILFLCLSGISAKASETMPAFTSVTATPKHDRIELSWEYPKYYNHIEVTRNGNITKTIDNDRDKIYDGFLDTNTTYHYELTAVDDYGNKSPSYKIDVTTLDGLKFYYKNNELTIDWSVLDKERYFNEREEVIEYKVNRTGFKYKEVNVGTFKYTYVDKDLEQGATYHYSITFKADWMEGGELLSGDFTVPIKTVTVMPYTELYASPTKKSQLPYSLDGQEVTVVGESSGFTKIKTWKGDLYVDNADIAQLFTEPKRLYFVKNASLHSAPNFKAKSGGALAPQEVYITHTGNNGWFRIKTDIGPKWVYVSTPFYNTGPWQLYIGKTTTLYDDIGKINKHAVIAPQMVRLFGESNDYYAVSTWLGMKYIKK